MPSKREIEKLRLLGLGLGILVVPMFFGIQRGRRRTTGKPKVTPEPAPAPGPGPMNPNGDVPGTITEGPRYPQPESTNPSEGTVKVVTSETLDAAIASNSIVVIDVYATWCGPCMFMGPELEKVAARNRQIHFFKLDADQNADAVTQLGVKGLPYLILFINGEQVEEREGGPGSKSAAADFLEEHIGDWLALQ